MRIPASVEMIFGRTSCRGGHRDSDPLPILQISIDDKNLPDVTFSKKNISEDEKWDG